MKPLDSNQESGQLVFCTSGCFLFFHDGHKELLAYLVSIAKDSPVYVAVNSNKYLLTKHQEKIKQIIETEGQTELEKLDFKVQLDVKNRIANVKRFLGDRAIVLESDNLIDSIQDKKIVWVVGSDYKEKDFQERSKVFVVYITPRTMNQSSTDKLDKKIGV